MDAIQKVVRKDRKRLYDSIKDASEVEKRKRIAQRQAKLVREQEAVEREGGPSYASGAFNYLPIVYSGNDQEWYDNFSVRQARLYYFIFF